MTIIDLLQRDGFEPRHHATGEACSPCPGLTCGGRDRFVIYLEEDRYWCRKCGASGDAIQYCRDFHGMSFKEAAEHVGRPILNTGKILPAQYQKTSQKRPQSALWSEKAEALVKYAHETLMDDRDILNWLRVERGITEKTARLFKLGWLRENHFRDREGWGLEKTGKRLFLPSGLTIPWKNKRVRIRRDSPGDHGRYYVVPGSSATHMVIGVPDNTLGVVVESELDAILLTQEADRDLFTVALGSAQAKPDEALVEQLEQCPVILVALDADAAGKKASTWWYENFHRDHIFRTVIPGDAKDITDGFMNQVDLNVWLEASVSLCAKAITRRQGK